MNNEENIFEIQTQNKLPLEMPLKEAVDIYVSRMQIIAISIFLGIVISSCISGGIILVNYFSPNSQEMTAVHVILAISFFIFLLIFALSVYLSSLNQYLAIVKIMSLLIFISSLAFGLHSSDFRKDFEKRRSSETI